MRDYFERVLAEERRTLDARFNAFQLAVDKAETTSNSRLDQMNEVRGQLKDQAGTFVTRREMDERSSASDMRLSALENARSNFEGRLIVIGAIPGLIAVVIAIAGYLTRK